MEVEKLNIEPVAKQIHEKWIENRESQGWKYGEERNAEKKETPCMVPSEKLLEEEKEYDRELARLENNYQHNAIFCSQVDLSLGQDYQK
nr:RyR domain-containing protein [uncultured Draconibacterium sp.]